MEGTIEVDSVYNQGSVFTVRIPQRVVDSSPLGDAAKALKNNSQIKSEYNAKFTAPQGRVLIVDDNRLNLTVAVKILADTKMIIDTAESGYAALEMTAVQKYNLILMDHQMPGMDGIATLNEIRNQYMGLCRDVPIIALTANAGSEMAELYKSKGFQDYIVKPINSKLLESTVLKHLPRDLVNITAENDEPEFDIEVGNRIKKRIVVTTDSSCDLSNVLCAEYV